MTDPAEFLHRLLAESYVSLRENEHTRWLIVDASIGGDEPIGGGAITDDDVALLATYGIEVEDHSGLT